ncbi:MAG TPA: hypothetical protein VJ376_13525, partial [Pseudomonadota bacterium]|nr:hypothetical protein [Pseudomonadota bacterium]
NGYGLVGANIHWDRVFGTAVDLEIFGTNLADKLYYNNTTALFQSPFGIASRYLGEPRMYGMRFRIRFGAAAHGG